MKWRRTPASRAKSRADVDRPPGPADQDADHEVAEALQDPATRDLVIGHLRRTIDAFPPDHSERVAYFTTLGRLLLDRFNQEGNLDDLTGAVGAARGAVDSTPHGHPDRPATLCDLVPVLLVQYRHTNDGADLDEALRIADLAVHHTPEHHPLRAACLAVLGRALHVRWGRTSEPADLNLVIRTLELAVRAAPQGHPDRAEALGQLGMHLRIRFMMAGNPDDLNLAVQAGADAVQAANDDDHRTGLLNNLASALSHRFDQMGDLDDLGRAVEILDGLLQAAADDHPARAAVLYNLAYALIRRFERLGDVADINWAVEAAEEAVQSVEDEEKSGYLHNLGNALMNRFRRLGDLGDLNRAITILRESADEAPEGNLNRGLFLSDLGNALRLRFEQTGDRFERTGDLADLDEAIEVLRQAVTATGPEAFLRARHLHNLSLALEARFRRSDELGDLEEAVQAADEALRAGAGDHEFGRMHLFQAAATLFSRFQRTGDLGDLDRVIEMRRQAVQATPPDHPDRAGMLGDLGEALFRRFERLGELDVLDEVIHILRQAIQVTADGEPSWAPTRFSLGTSLERRFTRTGEPDDAEAAIDIWRRAASGQSVPAMTRIQIVNRLGQFAASLGQWSVALEGYAAAVKLLPLVAWGGARRADSERFVAQWAGLATAAASCAIAAGQAERGLDLLEQGRGVLWSQLLDARTDLSLLEASAPDLAGQLAELRATLDLPPGRAGPTEEDVADARARSDRVVDRQMALAQEWDALVAQARSLPGFEDFLRPRGVEDLRSVGSDGPVVVVNISEWRCDALAVTSEGIRVIPLPAVTVEDVVEHANRYLSALQGLEDLHRARSARSELERSITTTLEWLWDTIAEPVLAALGYTRATGTADVWPRLWWCPTGPLTLLPLHAAGSGVAGRSVMDRVVSSYASTLRTLVRSRATRPPMDSPTRALLVVAMPTTPGHAPLPEVEREVGRLSRLFPAGELTVLRGTNATRRTVREALAHHRWAHFSCHGGQDLSDPSRGGVVLEDGVLSVSEISADRHEHGEFAFLSACKTAVGGVTVPDEAITLVAALQHAGWRHVIGTTWSVWDTAAADVARAVYPLLLVDGAFDPGAAAPALHHAVRRLRDSAVPQPSLWVPFIHAGP